MENLTHTLLISACEQTEDESTMKVYKGDWDIDDKCPYAICKTHLGNSENLKNHIGNHHKMYAKHSKEKLTPFSRFLKINTPPSPCPNFFDNLHILKHPLTKLYPI
jgi:hypothetical protein